MNFHHKPVKTFHLEGQIYDDNAIIRMKDEYVRLLSLEMKHDGYVPRIDIDPQFTIEYVEQKKIYNFKLTVYGVFVGKRKCEWIQGIDGYKAIYIQSNKSSESLKAQV